MNVEEISLGDDADKKKKIEENIGKEVILNDEHHSWKHGILMKEEGIGDGDFQFNPSGERYQLKLIKHKEKLLLCYDDVKQLLVLTPYIK